MTERTLEDALAHAAKAQTPGTAHEYSIQALTIALADLALLADEVKRLRLCPQCGCDHATAYELGRRDERIAQALKT